MNPRNVFYQYRIKFILQEISLKERTLIRRTLKLVFILLNNLDVFRCTSEVMKIQLKYFVFFLNTSKSKSMSSVTLHMYLDIERDNGDDYNNRESSDEGCYE